MWKTTPEEFAEMMFCKSRKYCNRCRNDPGIRVAILANHDIQHNGKGCPLGLPWDTAPKDLPETARWECPGEPEHEAWKIKDKPRLEQLEKDILYERQYGRKALLELKVNEERIAEHEMDELNLMNGIRPNQCCLRERVGCNCRGNVWSICHYPGFISSGIDKATDYHYPHVNMDPRKRADVSEEVARAVAGDPTALDKAKFVAALESTCHEHKGCVAVLREHCEECWQSGALGTREDNV